MAVWEGAQMIESIRLGLIKWNAAPLMVVAFLCVITYRLSENLLSMTCDSSSAVYVALSGLIATMAGLLYKLYDSMQKNRGEQ